MAVEECSNGYFAASELLGDLLEGQALGGFGIEECLGGSWKAVGDGGLFDNVSLSA